MAVPLVQQRTFAKLQPLCSSLVKPELREKDRVEQLRKLATLLEGLTVNEVQSCFDYILWPQILIIDAYIKAVQGEDLPRTST